jgi:hypothetical protein
MYIYQTKQCISVNNLGECNKVVRFYWCYGASLKSIFCTRLNCLTRIFTLNFFVVKLPYMANNTKFSYWLSATRAIACALIAGQTRLVAWLAWTAQSARARHHLQVQNESINIIRIIWCRYKINSMIQVHQKSHNIMVTKILGFQLRRRRTTAISRPPRNKAKRSCKTNLYY